MVYYNQNISKIVKFKKYNKNIIIAILKIGVISDFLKLI
jgi:hypothetical protein